MLVLESNMPGCPLAASREEMPEFSNTSILARTVENSTVYANANANAHRMREDEEWRLGEEGGHRVLLGRLRVQEQRELEAVERTRAEPNRTGNRNRTARPERE